MWALFALIPRWAIFTTLAVFATSLLYVVTDYKNQAVTIEYLRSQNRSLGAESRVLEQSLKLSRETLDVLNTRLATRVEELNEFCADLTAVRNSTAPGADTPVGEPMGSVLETLKQREPKK